MVEHAFDVEARMNLLGGFITTNVKRVVEVIFRESEPFSGFLLQMRILCITYIYISLDQIILTFSRLIKKIV